MKESGKRRFYSGQFKKEVVLLVTEHGYSIVQTAQVVVASEKNLQRRVKQQAQERNVVNVWMLMNERNCCA